MNGAITFEYIGILVVGAAVTAGITGIVTYRVGKRNGNGVKCQDCPALKESQKHGAKLERLFTALAPLGSLPEAVRELSGVIGEIKGLVQRH